MRLLQAIQAALDKKATIISMSWTLPIARGKDESKDKCQSLRWFDEVQPSDETIKIK